MARRISSSDDLKAFYTEVDNLYEQVDSIMRTYSTDINDINTNYSQLNYNDWQDDVKDRLETTLERDIAKDSIDAITSDLSSGGIVDLKNTLDDIAYKVEDAADKKDEIERLTAERDKLPAKVGTGEYKYTQNTDWRGSAYGGSGNYHTKTEIMKDNPAIEEYNTQINAKKKELESLIEVINSKLEYLTTIVFLGNTSGDGDSDSSYEDEEPVVTTDNTDDLFELADSMGDGIYKVSGYNMNGVTVDVYFDDKTGNRIYVNPANGRVFVVETFGDGSTTGWFTTTSDGNHFGGGWPFGRRSVDESCKDMLTDHRSEGSLSDNRVISGNAKIGLSTEAADSVDFVGLEETLTLLAQSGDYGAF